MVQLYKTYLFKDKDPVVDMLRTIVQETGMSYKQIADISGVSQGTLTRWFYGDTRRPQHATVMAVARACGYDMKFGKMGNRPRLVVSNGHIASKSNRKKGG